MMSYPALFLDRDGVINIDYGYVWQKENFEFVEGIFDLCKSAMMLGCRIFIITNQAGIGRGYYSEKDFLILTDWMCEVFKSHGILIDNVYFCPFHPEHGVGLYKQDSFYRKPKPGMILQAAKEFNIDLSQSFLVGDKETDIRAGVAAGIGVNILYESRQFDHLINSEATLIVRSLNQAQIFILSDNRGC